MKYFNSFLRSLLYKDYLVIYPSSQYKALPIWFLEMRSQEKIHCFSDTQNKVCLGVACNRKLGNKDLKISMPTILGEKN